MLHWFGLHFRNLHDIRWLPGSPRMPTWQCLINALTRIKSWLCIFEPSRMQFVQWPPITWIKWRLHAHEIKCRIFIQNLRGSSGNKCLCWRDKSCLFFSMMCVCSNGVKTVWFSHPGARTMRKWSSLRAYNCVTSVPWRNLIGLRLQSFRHMKELKSAQVC